MAASLFRTVVTNLPAEHADAVADAFGVSALPIDAAAVDLPQHRGEMATVELYSAAPLDEGDVAALLAACLGDAAVHIHVAGAPVEERDWVAQSQAGLAPISAGRFFVHGSHDRHRRPPGRHAIEIEAGEAFGTGHHATTKGCLIVFERILKTAPPRRILDIGSGSGILAIAAARATRRRVVAADIDPVATRVAAANARLNGVASLVRTFTAAGTRHAFVRDGGPYDLVFANILARPLIALAPHIRAVLAIGGRAILSGLTVDQEAQVLSAYMSQGLVASLRSRQDDWSTLVVQRSLSARCARPKRRREFRRG
jgi:ribosomal protein L11 methyltransferase